MHASTVLHMTAVLCVKAFGGGSIVNALVIFWLVERFDASLAESGTLFFCAGILAASAYRTAAHCACRPRAIELIADCFRLRSQFCTGRSLPLSQGFLSQFDVPTRTAFVFMSHIPTASRASPCCHSVWRLPSPHVRTAPVRVSSYWLASGGGRMCLADLCVSVL